MCRSSRRLVHLRALVQRGLPRDQLQREVVARLLPAAAAVVLRQQAVHVQRRCPPVDGVIRRELVAAFPGVVDGGDQPLDSLDGFSPVGKEGYNLLPAEIPYIRFRLVFHQRKNSLKNRKTVKEQLFDRLKSKETH